MSILEIQFASDDDYAGVHCVRAMSPSSRSEHMPCLRALSLLVGVGIVCGACQSADLVDPEDYEQSEQSLVLDSRLGTALVTRNTCGLSNNLSPRCVTSVAPDESHFWKAPSNGTYKFTVTSSDFFNVLVVAPFSTPFMALGCAGGRTSSILRLPLTAGQELQVTIDGENSLCGTYTLGITKECPTACDSPPPCREAGFCTVNGVCSYPPLCGSGEVCQGGQCVPRCSRDPSFPC
jgi:hypothetical protein